MSNGRGSPTREAITWSGPSDVTLHERTPVMSDFAAPRDGEAVRFAYADPPYLGQARRHYGPNAREVNHPILIATLRRQFPDGWALSCSSPSLQTLLPLCPPDVRVLAWVKPFASFKPGVGVAYAWEPVIVRGGRRRTRTQPTIRDWRAANPTRRTGIAGAKPETFCRWLFSVLNA